ncbi:MAG: HlyD family secretion protein, partial [Gemmataceae bacterium]
EGGVRPLYPTIPGRVVQAPVPDGKEVEADTVLLQLDDSLAQARLNEAEVDLKAANEKLEQARKLVSQHETRKKMQIASLNAAKEKNAAAEAVAKKARRLFDQNIGGSREDVDGASRLVNEAKALVDAENARLDLIKSMDAEAPVRLAQLEVDAKSKQVEKAKVGVRECKILAPTRGMILRRLVNVGEMIGQIPNRPAIEFCPAGDRIVRAEVEQEFAPSLKEGQKAEITDEFSKNSKWEGEVIRISHWYTQRRTVLVEPTQFNDIRTLEVILRIKSGYSEPLRINQRVQVKFKDAAGN